MITEKRQRGSKAVQFAGGVKSLLFCPGKILKTYGDTAWEMDIPQKRNYLTLEKQFAMIILPVDFSERGGVYETIF